MTRGSPATNFNNWICQFLLVNTATHKRFLLRTALWTQKYKREGKKTLRSYVVNYTKCILWTHAIAAGCENGGCWGGQGHSGILPRDVGLRSGRRMCEKIAAVQLQWRRNRQHKVRRRFVGRTWRSEIRELVSEGISVGNPWVTGQVTRVGGGLPWWCSCCIRITDLDIQLFCGICILTVSIILNIFHHALTAKYATLFYER